MFVALPEPMLIGPKKNKHRIIFDKKLTLKIYLFQNVYEVCEVCATSGLNMISTDIFVEHYTCFIAGR